MVVADPGNAPYSRDLSKAIDLYRPVRESIQVLCPRVPFLVRNRGSLRTSGKKKRSQNGALPAENMAKRNTKYVFTQIQMRRYTDGYLFPHSPIITISKRFHHTLGNSTEPRIIQFSKKRSLFPGNGFPGTDFHHIHDECIVLNRENSPVPTDMKRIKGRLLRSFLFLYP